MKIVQLQILLLMLVANIYAQEKTNKGTIIFITGDAIYTSLGKNSGIEDSSLTYVISKNDTLAILKVFATSSKTSVCKILKSKKQLHIGDVVISESKLSEIPIQSENLIAADTTQAILSLGVASLQNLVEQRNIQPLISVQGNVSVQYFTNRQSISKYDFTQPGLSLNIRGKVRNAPIKFQLYGNIRSLFFNNSKPINQSMIYHLSLDYDDNINQVSIGRLIIPQAPSIGYVDGISFSKKFDSFTFGAAAGIDPNFPRQNYTANLKKFSLFGSYQSTGSTMYAINIAYGRTFYQSLLDREVVSSSLTIIPFSTIYIGASSEVDLHTKKDQDLILKPQLTNITANINYHPLNIFSMGLSMNAWRSAYRFSIVKSIADSLLDRKMRFSPAISLNLFLPGNVSVYNTYSPHPTDYKFGREYTNNTTVGISNLFSQGIYLRGTTTINTTIFSKTLGYGISIQKQFANIVDASFRYQFYRPVIVQNQSVDTYKTLGFDLMVSPIANLTVWGSLEKLIRLDSDAYTLYAEISWRF